MGTIAFHTLGWEDGDSAVEFKDLLVLQVGSPDGWKLLLSQVEPIIGVTSDHPMGAGGVRGCTPISMSHPVGQPD